MAAVVYRRGGAWSWCTRGLRAVSSDTHYDLRPCGAECPTPFECNGEPTDITQSLKRGSRQVGYSAKFADNWTKIFENGKPAPKATVVEGGDK